MQPNFVPISTRKGSRISLFEWFLGGWTKYMATGHFSHEILCPIEDIILLLSQRVVASPFEILQC